jgi:hypothetical protein
MKIIQQYINSKTGDMSLCEDSIVTTDNFIAIVDGATSRSKIKYSGKTNGKVASELVAKTISELPGDTSAGEAFLKCSEAIADFYKHENLYEHMISTPADRCAASVLIFSSHFQELWFIGDCQALVNNELINNVKKVDTLFEELRSFYIEWELRNGKTIEELRKNDTGRDAVIPFIDRQQVFQNIEEDVNFAFTTIDGFFKDTSSIKKIPISDNSGDIVIASDGYPKIFSTLDETENYLEEIIKKDPLCFREFKAVKGVTDNNVSYDDRSYVRFSLTD